MTGLFFWFLLCLLLYAFFSASELAFLSADKMKIRQMADEKNAAAKKVMDLYDKPQHFLTTLLIGNSIVNIAATSILTYFLSTGLGIKNEWVVTLIMTPVFLLGGEVLPKDYGRLHGQRFLLFYAGLLKFIRRIFKIFTKLILKWVDSLLAPLGPTETKSIFVNEKEFRSLIEEITKSGVVSAHEKKIIDTILDFEKVKVKDVMLPISEAPKLEIQGKVKDAKKLAREIGARMILIYEEDPSIVVGMVYVFDLLFEDDDEKGLRPFLRSPIFIPESTSNEKAFFTLQQKRQSYCAVMDSRHDVVGVVGIERLLAF
ncbi:MAG TPA: CNNM domain-containing protein [Verrucomicrobiae bacterium]|jgi:CBS domain containing-hemolysin-like protein|nr:CNNM domain-containing protein [Verrucomicrobiae bacterium]